MPDYLLELAHRKATGEHSLSDKEKRILPDLIDLALDALDSGVTITLKDWAFMTPVSQRAFAAAGRRRSILNANLSALAASGPVGRAMALSEIDDGATLEKVLMDQAMEDLNAQA